MNSSRTDSTNVAVCTYVEWSVSVLAEKVAVFCHSFLPTSLLYRKEAVFKGKWPYVPVAQLDRASASGAEGFVFESRRGY